MKDIISTLQSRIAKRARFMNKEYVCIQYSNGDTDFKTMAQEPHHSDSIYFTAQQKTDKRALAEIIRLRREIVDEKKGRKAVLELGCDRVGAHAKALEKSREEVAELRAQIKELEKSLELLSKPLLLELLRAREGA